MLVPGGPLTSRAQGFEGAFHTVRDDRMLLMVTGIHLSLLRIVESRLLAGRLTELLAATLEARFAAVERPPGNQEVPSGIHARFVAAGLSELLLGQAVDADAMWRSWPRGPLSPNLPMTARGRPSRCLGA